MPSTFWKGAALALACCMVLSLGGCQSGSARQGESVLVDAVQDQDPQSGYPMENPPAFFSQKGEEADTSRVRDSKILHATYTSVNDPVAATSFSYAPPVYYEPLTKEEEMRAVWISYLDLKSILTGATESEYRKNLGKALDNIRDLGLNTVIFQVRPFGDALYPSAYFPWSFVATGTEGKDPGFDPLAIAIEEAEKRDLAVEAWINPYRVRTADRKEAISAANPVNKMLKSGDALTYNGGTYYNPASEAAQELIVNGVTELVKNYDITAIHFDDYFYPTTDPEFDADSYAAYQKAGGRLSLEDWRRENVNTLVRKVYQAVHDTAKETGKEVRFGISPQGNRSNNYKEQYIDVDLWLREPGYVDYIAPQIYFGFENASRPFVETAAEWSRQVRLPNIDLYIGLAPFKLGQADQWAGDSGKEEWLDTTDILARMVQTAREQSAYGGFALFRYDSLFHPSEETAEQVETELANLKDTF